MQPVFESEHLRIFKPEKYLEYENFNPVDSPDVIAVLEAFLPSGCSLCPLDGIIVDFKNKKPVRIFQLFEYELKNFIDKKTFFRIIGTFLKEYFGKSESTYKYTLSSQIMMERYQIGTTCVFCPKINPSEFNKFNEIISKYYIYLEEMDSNNSFFYRNVDKFRIYIRNFRKKSFPPERRKKLYKARTLLECYLADTEDPWPEDIDGLLLVKIRSEYIPASLLEVKVHNLDTPLEEEHVEKYSDADVVRLTALKIISDYLKIPLFFLIWERNSLRFRIQKYTPGNKKFTTPELIEGWGNVVDFILNSIIIIL